MVDIHKYPLKPSKQRQMVTQPISSIEDRDYAKSHSVYTAIPSVRINIILLGMLGALVVGGCMNNIGFAITCMVDHESISRNHSLDQNYSMVHPNCRKRLEDSHADSGYQGYFPWDRNIQGYILSSTAWGCLISAPFIGWIPDKYGAKWCFFIGTLINGIATLLCPWVASNYQALIVMRIIEGAGAGVLWPCLVVIVARWAAITEVGTMLSLAATGLFSGSLVNLLISGVICSTIGWAWLFYIWGIAALIWAVVWIFLYTDDPGISPLGMSSRELAFINREKSIIKKTSSVKIPWGDICTSSAVWSIIYCCFAMTAFVFFINDYIPTYMKDVLYQPSIQNGILSAVPFIAETIGRNFAGFISDRIKWFGPTLNVKIFNGICFVPPGILLMIIAFLDCTQVPAAVTLLSFAQFFQAFVTSGYMKGIVLMAPSFASSIILLGNISGYAGGVIIPYIIPLIVKQGTLEEWRLGFFFVAITMFIGAILFSIFGTGTAKKWGIATGEGQALKKQPNIVL